MVQNQFYKGDDNLYEIVVMGVDQGIANCGYGIIKMKFKGNDFKFKVIDYGLIITDSDKSMGNRALEITNKIDELIKTNKPVIIGCEKLFFSQVRKSGRNKSASILYTNMATGLLQYLSGKNAVPLVDFVPGTVKKNVTGYGRATKEEMIKSIEDKVDDDTIEISNEHIADAIAIAITAGVEYNKNKEYYKELTKCIKKI